MKDQDQQITFSGQVLTSKPFTIKNIDQPLSVSFFRVACRKLLVGTVAAILVCSVHQVNAQLATAQVDGMVHDPTSAVIPEAQIKVTQTSTGIVTNEVSNSAGSFAFVTLPVGSYLVEVSAPGFTAYRKTGVVLTVGQHLTRDVALKVGSSDTVVTVAAAAVSVDSTTPTEQSIINEKVLRDLPLNGRNPATLTFTVAGVTDSTLNISSGDSSSTIKEADAVSPQSSAPSVHGARPGGTYFSLDGATNTDPFSVIGVHSLAVVRGGRQLDPRWLQLADNRVVYPCIGNQHEE